MPSVLIVDDDLSSLNLLTHLFEGRGYTATTARSLAEARNNLESRPDLCVVDLLLPDGKGTDLLDEGLAQHSDVVVLTGHASVESTIHAFRKGARDYLTKPLSRDEIDRLFEHLAPSQSAKPVDAPISVHFGDSLAEVEQRLILHTVKNCRTQDEAARMLGVSTKTIYNKLRLYESHDRASRDNRASRDAGNATDAAAPAKAAWCGNESSRSVG